MEHNAEEKSFERIALKMTSSLDLHEVLISITQGLVDELDAALARIWLIGPGDLCSDCHKVDSCTNRQSCLHLIVSAGIHTRTNGEMRRVPLGALKIGGIAQGAGSLSTNDVMNDERVYNKKWLKENELRSFAGHPLIFGGETLGVLSMFSRRVMEQEEFSRIALFANQAAVAIKNAQLFEALKESEVEHAAIIESTPDPLVITSKNEGRILYANPQFGAAFGLSANELIGRTVPDLYYDPSDRKKLLARISQTGSVHNYEIRLKKIDGTPLWVSASVQPLVFRED